MTAPLPQRGTPRKWPLDTLKVGQHFAYHCEPAERRRIGQRLYSSAQWLRAKSPAKRFAVRNLPDGSGVGVWRTA